MAAMLVERIGVSLVEVLLPWVLDVDVSTTHYVARVQVGHCRNVEPYLRLRVCIHVDLHKIAACSRILGQ